MNMILRSMYKLYMQDEMLYNISRFPKILFFLICIKITVRNYVK